MSNNSQINDLMQCVAALQCAVPAKELLGTWEYGGVRQSRLRMINIILQDTNAVLRNLLKDHVYHTHVVMKDILDSYIVFHVSIKSVYADHVVATLHELFPEGDIHMDSFEFATCTIPLPQVSISYD